MVMQKVHALLRTLAVMAVFAGLVSACGGGGGGGGSAASAVTGSGSQTGGPETNAPVQSQDAQVVTFMELNDLHAHLTPHKDLEPDGNGGTRVVERGGLARTASLIRQIRAENPNSVLMNIGDTYHGGAEALFTLGNAIVDPVNGLGIDVGVPGNWDFGFSSTIFRLRYTNDPLADVMADNDDLRPVITAIKKPNFPNLAANMTYTSTGKDVLPATLMKEVGGVKVGFIGITSDIVKFVYPLLAPAFDFVGENMTTSEAEQAYRDLVNGHAQDLRDQGAAIVVVMSELGIHKDHRLAQVVNAGAVDVFFSAHTHEATRTPLTSDSGALVVEAGNDGYLGRMDITVKDGKVTDRQWELLTIGQDLPEDPAVKALVDKARAPFMAIDVNVSDPMPNSLLALVEPLDTVVGTTPFPIDRRSALESSFNNAMADILRHYGNTDLAMTPGFRFDSVVAPGALLEDNTIASGDVTLEDIYRFYPLMFAIATGEVSGERLREIIEQSLSNTFSKDAFVHKGGWLEGWSGLSLTVNLDNPDGQRVLDMRLKDTGQVISDSSIVSVTGCKRPIEPRDMLCRHSGFQNVFPLIGAFFQTGEPWTIIDLLVEGISTGVLFDAMRRDIVDINGTPAWPDSPFIQPVHGVQ